jgi:hypothetical protein
LHTIDFKKYFICDNSATFVKNLQDLHHDLKLHEPPEQHIICFVEASQLAPTIEMELWLY